MAYTIKEIADLGGVTTRTLRYYDEIGLLRPTFTGENGYRYYDADCLLRLQQILFFRELEVPLKDIQRIISRPDFNLLQSLRNHRTALQSRASRLDTLPPPEPMHLVISPSMPTIGAVHPKIIRYRMDCMPGFRG